MRESCILLYIESENILKLIREYANCEQLQINWPSLLKVVKRRRVALVQNIYALQSSSLDSEIAHLYKSNKIGNSKVKTRSVADCVVNLMSCKFNGLTDSNSVIILMLGDLHLQQLIELALDYNYKVEFWTFSDNVPDYVKLSPRISVYYFDDILSLIIKQ